MNNLFIKTKPKQVQNITEQIKEHKKVSPLAHHRPFPHVVGTPPQFVSLDVLAIPPLKLSS